MEEFGLLFIVTGEAEPTSERLGLMLALSPEGMSAPGGASAGIRPQVFIVFFYSLSLYCHCFLEWVGMFLRALKRHLFGEGHSDGVRANLQTQGWVCPMPLCQKKVLSRRREVAKKACQDDLLATVQSLKS